MSCWPIRLLDRKYLLYSNSLSKISQYQTTNCGTGPMDTWTLVTVNAQYLFIAHTGAVTLPPCWVKGYLTGQYLNISAPLSFTLSCLVHSQSQCDWTHNIRCIYSTRCCFVYNHFNWRFMSIYNKDSEHGELSPAVSPMRDCVQFKLVHGDMHSRWYDGRHVDDPVVQNDNILFIWSQVRCGESRLYVSIRSSAVRQWKLTDKRCELQFFIHGIHANKLHRRRLLDSVQWRGSWILMCSYTGVPLSLCSSFTVAWTFM